MPPLPFVPDVVKLVVGGVANDAQWLNIFHFFHSDGTVDDTAIGNLHTHIIGDLDAIYHSFASITVTVENETYTDISSDTGVEISFSDDTSGTDASALLPASACTLVSWEIARRYRGGHPRTYFPIGTVGSLASDSSKLFDPTYLEAVSAACETFRGVCSYMDGGTGFTWNLASVSYTSGLTPRPIPIHDNVTSAVVRERVCSQRRRLGKIGG